MFPYPTMNIYAKRGDFIVYSFPGNGYKIDQEHAAKTLKLNQIYTVNWVEVGGSHSYVRLMEFQDVSFNSVIFSNYQKVN